MCDNTLKQELNEAQVGGVATKVMLLRMTKLHTPLTVITCTEIRVRNFVNNRFQFLKHICKNVVHEESEYFLKQHYTLDFPRYCQFRSLQKPFCLCQTGKKNKTEERKRQIII